MPITKEQKKTILDDLAEKIAKQKAIIFVDFSGLKVKDLVNLRKKLKAFGSQLKVVKKTLIRLALEKIGLKMNTDKLKGEIALIFGFEDEISPAKAIWQFSQENQNLKILSGILENQFVEQDRIVELAKLPTKEELLARLVGSVASPMSGFINVLQGNVRGLIYILSQIKPSTQ